MNNDSEMLAKYKEFVDKLYLEISGKNNYTAFELLNYFSTNKPK